MTYQMNPDQMGPIFRNTADGKKQLVHARWGLPPPRFALEKVAKAKAEKLAAKCKPFDLEELIRMEADRGTTNVRKLSFPHWKRWFGVENRCLVPVTRSQSRIQLARSLAETCRMPGSPVTNRSR
jgi:putative SOS response-associated peptidase YedK